MILTSLLETFSLSHHEQETYLLLLKYPWSTVLTISKKSSIKRSSLYRVIDSLMIKGLVEMKVDDKTTYYKAADPSVFESLVTRQEQKALDMRKSLSNLVSQLTLLTQIDPSSTGVHFYRGAKGIEAIEWKMARQSNSELLVFGIDEWWRVIGHETAEKIRQRHIEQNIHLREILNKEKYITGEWTQVTGLESLYQERYISKDKFPIENELVISPDAFYIYSITPDEVSGIEIINQGYVNLMKSLFEMVWSQALKPDDVKVA